MSVLYRPRLSRICKKIGRNTALRILELMREKFPDLYFASIVKLAQIVRIEADVSLKEPKPKTIEEVLQRVEHEPGVEGRRAFEGFLKKMDKTKEEQGDE
jgi:hypothetical protein